MVKITFFQNKEQEFLGFDCVGHAEYSDENDIVCAGASALVINCINSIETFSEVPFTVDSDENSGMISFRLEQVEEEKAQLLLSSLALGLEEMESNYEENIDVIFEEV